MLICRLQRRLDSQRLLQLDSRVSLASIRATLRRILATIGRHEVFLDGRRQAQLVDDSTSLAITLFVGYPRRVRALLLLLKRHIFL